GARKMSSCAARNEFRSSLTAGGARSGRVRNLHRSPGALGTICGGLNGSGVAGVATVNVKVPLLAPSTLSAVFTVTVSPGWNGGRLGGGGRGRTHGGRQERGHG